MTKLPSGIEINNLIDDLRKLSWEAAETLLYYSQILKDPNNKSNILKNDDKKNPVTIADLKVNEIIIRRINEKYKNVNWDILSEESVKVSSDSFNINSEWVWVLDPLDGTKDFIQGTTNYAMHLGLNFKKKPLLGVVLIPEKEELWISDGEKVWVEKRNKNSQKPHLSHKKMLKDMILVTSKNHKNETLRKLIDKVGFKKVINMGSVGCKIASILRGEADIYISLSLPGTSSPKDWDFAAPEAILRNAGGAITNIYNEELSYGGFDFEQGGIIVASNNKLIHRSICLEIKEKIKEHKIYPFLKS